MATGYFETEPSQPEAQVEEINDFDLLVHEVGESSREEALVRMSDWIDRFQRGWTNGSDQWGMLVELLPRPKDVQATVGQFRKQLLSATREASASDYFLTNPAVVSKLSSYAWTDFLDGQAVGFVAGCLNLARAAAQSGSPSSTVMGTLSNALANYHTTLIGIALHDPGLVIATEDGCSLADALDVPRERFERWTFEKSEQELQSLIANFEVDRLQEVLRALFGQAELPTSALTPLVKTALAMGDDPNAVALTGLFAFESAEIAAELRDRASKAEPGAKAAALALWARYLVPSDAFAFGWECVRPSKPDSPAPLGDALEERLRRFEELLRISRHTAVGAHQNGAAPARWRETTLRAMAAIGTLVAGKWSEREDQVVCEDEAITALGSNPELLALTVAGILDHCAEHWPVLDPVILRLPTDALVPVLTEYCDRAPVGSDGRHHSARLLSRAKGEPVVAQSDGDLPPPAESLPHPARQRAQLASQTWLADGAIERLWHVALEVAQSRFDEALATRYADDKEDHCALLADALAKALNGTNSALKMWLRWNGAAPATIQATARRLPPRKKGAGGLQADLGLLVRCTVGGKSVTERLTLLRVKKLSAPANGGGWPTSFRLNGTERTQLSRLLTMSPSTHYLFVSPPELGASLRVLPGGLVRDVLAAQGIGGGVSAQTVFQAGVRLPEFLLFHVLGLWTGDDDEDLVAKAEADADPDQAPHVVLEMTVSK